MHCAHYITTIKVLYIQQYIPPSFSSQRADSSGEFLTKTLEVNTLSVRDITGPVDITDGSRTIIEDDCRIVDDVSSLLPIDSGNYNSFVYKCQTLQL